MIGVREIKGMVRSKKTQNRQSAPTIFIPWLVSLRKDRRFKKALIQIWGKFFFILSLAYKVLRMDTMEPEVIIAM